MADQTTLGFSTHEFGDAPDSVRDNVSAMETIVAQRRAANQRTAEKNDTERYLVVVFRDRVARESALRALGLPHDERYVLADVVELRVKDGKRPDDALVLTERSTKAADIDHSGAGG